MGSTGLQLPVRRCASPNLGCGFLFGHEEQVYSLVRGSHSGTYRSGAEPKHCNEVCTVGLSGRSGGLFRLSSAHGEKCERGLHILYREHR